MSFTFVSRRGGGADTGVIVLWYGLKADIPDGWEYYSAAAGKLVMGATTADTTALGSSTHTHSYTGKTGLAGTHSHSITMTVGEPINATLPSFYEPGTDNAYWAGRYHTNHTQSLTVGNDPNHDHSLLDTGSGDNKPSRFGLYFIRKI